MKNLLAGGRLAWGLLFLAPVPGRGETRPVNPVLATADSTRNTLTLGLTASNNTYFFGRSTDTKYPYLTADAIYKFRSGIWLSASFYNVFQTNSLVDETDLSAGYDFSLSDRLTGSLSYARYIYGPDNPLIRSAVSNVANAFLGLDWSYLYTSLTTSYIFGGASDVFFSLNNSRYFGTRNAVAGGDYLGIEPTFNLLGGTQTFTRTYTTTRAPLQQKPNKPARRRPVPVTHTVSETRFSLLNYGLTLPVSYTLQNSSLELSWRLVVPVNAPEEFSTRPQSFFTLSFYQTFR